MFSVKCDTVTEALMLKLLNVLYSIIYIDSESNVTIFLHHSESRPKALSKKARVVDSQTIWPMLLPLAATVSKIQLNLINSS